MKTSSYLTIEKKQSFLENSYIKESFWGEEFDVCSQIPDELNVFSNIFQNDDLSTFIGSISEGEHKGIDNAQTILLQEMENEYKKIMVEYSNLLENGTIFPKFEMTKDEDGVVALNLTTANYNFFITLEKNIDNSFYGLFFKEKNSYSSKTDLLTKDNLTEVVQNLAQLLLKNA